MNCSCTGVLVGIFKIKQISQSDCPRLAATFLTADSHQQLRCTSNSSLNMFQYAERIRSEIIFINSTLTPDVISSSIYAVKLGNELSRMARLCIIFCEFIQRQEESLIIVWNEWRWVRQRAYSERVHTFIHRDSLYGVPVMSSFIWESVLTLIKCSYVNLSLFSSAHGPVWHWASERRWYGTMLRSSCSEPSTEPPSHDKRSFGGCAWKRINGQSQRKCAA